MAASIASIQAALTQRGLDGWLFYDFHNRDVLGTRILGLSETGLSTRRWYYFIPAQGTPVRIVHAVEPEKLDSLPGRKIIYLSWEQQHTAVRDALGTPPRKIAMQYSPMNNIPYISMVDAGTIELIRSFGHEIVSSADLVQIFEAIIDETGFASHVEAGRLVQRIKDEAFEEIRDSIRSNTGLTEFDVASHILQKFEANGLITHDMPIVGVNDHPANPHFEPTRENARSFRPGDCVLIDLWAKLKKPKSIYYDITWCGYIGSMPPAKYSEIWLIVVDARKTAVEFIRERFRKGEKCFGWEVDDACRAVVRNAGYDRYFVHRTGHSIGEEVHGNGVHIDNLETKEERELVPGICFSIEPGIYLKGEMAVRSEINVCIKPDGDIIIAGAEQEELLLI